MSSINPIIVVNKHKMHEVGPRTFYIGRPSALGNPYPIGFGCSRDQAVARYETWLMRRIQEGDPNIISLLDQIATLVMDNTGQPVYLVCYCAPLACHGDVIRRVILTAIALENNHGVLPSESELAHCHAGHPS